MTNKPLFCQRVKGRNRGGPNGVGSTDPALRHSEPIEEVRHMPFEHDIGQDGQKFNRERCENWQPIGDVAARVVKAVRK